MAITLTHLNTSVSFFVLLSLQKTKIIQRQNLQVHCIEEEKNDGVGKVARSSNSHELKMGIGNFIAQQLQQTDRIWARVHGKSVPHVAVH